MKKMIVMVCGCFFMLSLAVTGCAQEKVSSSDVAIENAQAMETVEEKVNYLLGQTKAFYNSDEFQEAVYVAKYILNYVDKDSQQAQDWLEKAKQALANKAQEAVDSTAESTKQKIGNLGQ